MKKRNKGLRTLAIYGLLTIVCVLGLGLLSLSAENPTAAISSLWISFGALPLIGLAQLNGADSRMVIRKESTFKTLPTLVIHDCEAAWDELVDADATVTADTSVFKLGAKAMKAVVAAALGAGDIVATDSFAAKDLSGYTMIGFWFRSSVELDAGDYQILLDDTAVCASPIESLDIPAFSAADVALAAADPTYMKYMKIALVAPASCTAIISLGFKCIVDKPGTFYIDDVRALEGEAMIIPFNTAEFGMQEDLEESASISSGRQPLMPTGGNISGAGSSSHEMDPYLAVLFMKHLLGGSAVTDLGAGVGQVVFTIGDVGEGLAVEIQHTEEDIYTVYHAKINTASVKQAATGKVSLDLGWEVAAEEAATLDSTLDGDPDNYGHKPFSSKFGAFTEGGSSAPALVTNLTLGINNQVEGEPTIGSEGEKDSLTPGRVKLDFSMDMLYKDNTYQNKAKNLTESSLQIVHINGTGAGSANNEYFGVEFPEILYARPKQKIDGPRGLKATYSGIAYYDDDAGGQAVEITVKAPLASINAILA